MESFLFAVPVGRKKGRGRAVRACAQFAVDVLHGGRTRSFADCGGRGGLVRGGKGIMKNGLWIGGLVLALFARGSDLIAEDVQWRSLESAPATEAPGVSLDRPVALQARPRSGAKPAAFAPTGETT